MSLRKARQLNKARAHFSSLMALGPLATNDSHSFKSKLLSVPLWQPKQLELRSNETRSLLIRTKIDDIKRRSTPSHPVCLKCGDRGHLARFCRNALICFLCNKTGHKSSTCHSITSIPFQLPTHSIQSATETAMAPLGTRRGAPRARYQSFSARPSPRPPQDQPPGQLSAAHAPPQYSA